MHQRLIEAFEDVGNEQTPLLVMTNRALCYTILVVAMVACAALGFFAGLAWSYAFFWAAGAVPNTTEVWRALMLTIGEIGAVFSFLFMITFPVGIFLIGMDWILSTDCGFYG